MNNMKRWDKWRAAKLFTFLKSKRYWVNWADEAPGDHESSGYMVLSWPQASDTKWTVFDS